MKKMDSNNKLLAFLCPTFPPKKCGVGDHVFPLQAQFKDSVTFTFWPESNTPAIVLKDPCPTSDFLNILKKKYPNVKTLSIHYTPNLYSTRPWNIKIHLNWLILKLKWKGLKVFLTAHESNYPFGLNLRGFFFGGPQLVTFFFLSHFCHEIIFCHEKAYLFWQKKFFWLKQKMHWFPVGATITAQQYKTNYELKSKITLAHFGAKHPTQLVDVVLKSYVKLRKKYPEKNIELLFLGNDHNSIKKELELYVPKDYLKDIRPLGFLPAEQISVQLCEIDALLLPFMDGVSSRRSTIMNGLAHKTPIITNRGYSSEISLPWEKLTYLAESIDLYDEVLEQFLEQNSNSKNIKCHEAHQYYQENFSWESLANRYQKLIEKDQR